MPPVLCRWVWDGIEWGEDPGAPHNCPEGKHCDPPAEAGTYVGEERDTTCDQD